jgi:hypothetical protein
MLLKAAGMFLVALGFIWALQGVGVLHWPPDSFMLGQGEWAARGTGAVLAGAALIAIAAWRARR